MTPVLSAEELRRSVAGDSAVRRVRRLQPAGGRSEKIFPPTYPGDDADGRKRPPRHVFEDRRIDGETVHCVLIDSVQSQANRLEEALLAAARDLQIELPRVEVNFRGQRWLPRGIAGVEA